MPATDHAAIPRPTPPTPTPPMVTRTVRVAQPLWDDAAAVAEREGLSLSEVIRHYLTHYVDTAPAPTRGRRS